MKVWVVGAGGLLGSTLCKLAPDLCISSRKEEANVTDLHSLRSFVQKNQGITHIVNCSAYSLVELAEIHRAEAYEVNALGPENVGKIAKEIDARCIHISTDYVFSGDLHRHLSEEDPVGPLNYYGITKLEGEKRFLSVLPSACIIRTSSIFGSEGKNFVAKLFQHLIEKEEIFLANDQWNSPTFVEDLGLAILHMLDATGLYHFANRGEATKFSFGIVMRDYAVAMGLPVAAKRLIAVASTDFPSLCERPRYTVFNTSKIAKQISIRSWEEALHMFLFRMTKYAIH